VVLTNLEALKCAAEALFVLKSRFAVTLRRCVGPTTACLAATVAGVFAIAAPIASAQQVTVFTRITSVIALESGADLGAYALRVSTASTPTTNYQNDPIPNNCTFGVIYFGVNGNPSAVDRTNFMMLSTQGLIGTTVAFKYTKTTYAYSGGFKCVLDRYDMNY
jgi:hypothetical protein